MPSVLQAIAKQAQLTFSKCFTDEDFADSLCELVRSVRVIRAADLKLSRDVERNDNTDRNAAQPQALVTYIEIEENQTFSMGIFVLKSGARIPLHDHPGMHGVLKVIKGVVKITSYTSVSNDNSDNVIPLDISNRIKSSQRDSLVPVEQPKYAIVTDKDEPCVLRPREGNFHEIHALEGIAAFFDILSPPYDTNNRECNYYVVLESNKPDSKVKTWLLRSDQPSDFWYDVAPYTGPKVYL